MKKKVKRAIILAKRFTSDFVIGLLAWAAVIYSVWSVVSWGREKIRSRKEPEVVGEYLTENLRTVEKDGVVEIYNEELKKVVGRYQKVFAQNYGTYLSEIVMRSQEGSIMVVNEDDLFGYISPITGEVLVEPQYLLAWDSDMSSGLAACVNSEHKMGFINVFTKEIVIPFNVALDSAYFDYNLDYAYYDFIFRDGYSLVPGNDGRVGIINEAGEIVLPAEYSDIKTTRLYSLKKEWDELPQLRWSVGGSVIQEYTDYDDYDFQNPIIVGKSDSTGVKYGVFDMKKGMIIPMGYDNIDYALTERDNTLFICQNNGRMQILDVNGDVVCDHTYYNDIHQSVNIRVIYDSERQPTKYILYNTLDGWAVMNTDFQIIITPNGYWEINYLGDGVFVCEKDDYSVILKVE